MANKLPTFDEDMNIIQKLGDTPGTDDNLDWKQLQAKFDEGGNKLKTYLNKIVSSLNNILGAEGAFVSGGNLLGNINANGNRILGLMKPTKKDEAATKDYVDTTARPNTWTPTAADVGAQPKMVPWRDYILLTDCNNAGAHNAIYRGKNLGSTVTDAQWAAIKAGTFEDLFIGDFWEINGVNWRIAAFDYYLHTGDTECTAHHVVMVPDTVLYNAQMHNTSSGNYESGSANTTEGGYVATDMYKSNLTQAKTEIKNAFGSHVLNHRVYLANAVTNGHPSGVSWRNSEVELMNEQMVYGGPIFMTMTDGSGVFANARIEKSQLPLFKHDPSRLTVRTWWWLRDIVSSGYFAYVGGNGDAGSLTASFSGGVRPAFCIS